MYFFMAMPYTAISLRSPTFVVICFNASHLCSPFPRVLRFVLSSASGILGVLLILCLPSLFVLSFLFSFDIHYKLRTVFPYMIP